MHVKTIPRGQCCQASGLDDGYGMRRRISMSVGTRIARPLWENNITISSFQSWAYFQTAFCKECRFSIDKSGISVYNEIATQNEYRKSGITVFFYKRIFIPFFCMQIYKSIEREKYTLVISVFSLSCVLVYISADVNLTVILDMHFV